MYRHLMVPVDDSQLSAANVTSAVELACKLGARITFFHATMDFSATADGALLKMIAPSIYADGAVGDTNVLLSKAATVATAMRVAHETASAISDHPADAIVLAARKRGCDLIVMASRGARGAVRWLHSSQTEHVMQQSEIPVLVTRSAAAEPFTACDMALAVVQDEHRSIAVVAQGLQDWAAQMQQPLCSADLASVKLMLHYLQAFPLQQHHPREERYLHRLLRLRVPDCEPLLSEIEAEHAEHATMIKSLMGLLLEGPPRHIGWDAELLMGLKSLAEACLQHIRNEETTVLPLARARLLEEDWLAEGFDVNGTSGSRGRAATEFRSLFARIANNKLQA